MKLTKIFAFAVAALTLTACNNDDDYNTSNATVEMQDASMKVTEDFIAGTYYKVPIKVLGETDGPIRVTVEVNAVGQSPAIEDQDYLITEKSITIPAGDEIGYIEFYPVGDYEINDDRVFSMTIVSAKGATIGTQSTCIVTLVDNDLELPDKYAAVQGKYNLSAIDEFDEVPVEIKNLTCFGVEEGETGYLRTIYFSGWEGYNWMETYANFNYDVANEVCLFGFPLGQTMAEDVDFGASLGLADVVLGTGSYTEDGWSVSTSGRLTATSNVALTQIKFQPEDIFMELVSQSGSIAGIFGAYSNLILKR